ncbi:type I restriction-modification system subunit S [Actinobacillus indolicus]|nr:type I restriction-modification system subunit S [Actinobacillus indolicus]VTU06765.1 type I restriction-modification system subunit S [Actinobacillus indolicus]
MNRYESYKDSGVEWLGEVPSHWEVKKLKHIGYIYSGLTGKSGDDFSKEHKNGFKEFIPFTTICNFSQIKEENFQYVRTTEIERQNIVQKNDLLFLMSSETLEDIAKSSVYLLEKNSFLNSFCKGFRISSGYNSIFVNYLIGSKAYRNYFNAVGRGFTRVNIKQEYINDIPVIIPSILEQQKIAQYLDDKTAKIDQAIMLEEKQIELLKEHKQILIQNAVTKGLNPQVKFKDSGVEWLGEVPEHWEVKKLKYLGNAIIGLTYSPDDLCNESEGILVARSSNIQNGQFVYSDNVYVKKQVPEKLKLKNHDILICSRNGSRDLIGKCAYITEQHEKHTFGAFTTVFRSKYNSYLFYILNSEIFKALSGSFLTSTINQLTISNLNSIQIALPPLSEQTAIAHYLDEQTTKIDHAIQLKLQQIDKLKEYKTVLINDVVTGKVKVA